MRYTTILLMILGAGISGLLTSSCSPMAGPRRGAELALSHSADPLAKAGTPAGLEREIVERINRYRASKGKSELKRHAGLDKLARIHAGEMLRAGKMSHRNYHRRAFAAERSYRLENLAENLIWGRNIPASELGMYIERAWEESAGHRHNLLYANQYIGVAVVRAADGTFYGTQLSARDLNEYTPQPGGPMQMW